MRHPRPRGRKTPATPETDRGPAPASAGCLQTRCLTSLSQIEEVSSAWEDLAAEDGRATLFQSHPWILTWLRHHPQARPHVWIAERCGRLTAALPLCAHRGGPVRIRALRFVADEDSDYCLPLASPRHPGDLGLLWEALLARRDWDLLDLRHVPARSGRVHLAPAAPRHLAIRSGLEEIAPFLELGDGWMASLEKRHRQDMERCRRRLSERGNLALSVARTPEEVDRVLGELADMHIQRWRAQGEISRFCVPGYRAWLRDACHGLLARGQLWLCRLAVDDDPVSAAICLLDGRRLLLYIPSFAEAYRKYGPAHLLMAGAIAHAREQNLADVLDFGRGGEEYKLRWTQQVQTLERFLIARPTPGGVAAFLWHARVKPRLQQSGRLRTVLGRLQRRLARRWEIARTAAGERR